MKPFHVLLVGAAIWGVTVGLAFIGGVAVGNSQEDDAAPSALSAQPIGVDGRHDQFDSVDQDQLRQRIQSGEATQEELDQLRQRFRQGGGGRGQFGGGGDGPGGGRPGGGPGAQQSSNQAPSP
ncbi:MAG: hypothetical protein J4N34_04105 [Chloroflexi bacterium]|nr:hypothetical protein [Chloroflexota bacterium]